MARTPLVAALSLLLLGLAPLGCSSDDPVPDGGADQGAVADAPAPTTDTVQPVGDGNVLPWDQAVKPDLGNVSCTPGDKEMCDGNKNFQCVEGKCTACPASYVDCDRTGDCECLGACDGETCAAKPPKPPKK